MEVLDLIEALERIDPAVPGEDGVAGDPARPRFHYVILDYLCEIRGGTLCAGSDALELAWTSEDALHKFDLTVAATRVLRKAFAMARERSERNAKSL